MITYYGKLNNKKIAAQMLLGQEAICKTSFGWICGHQYYVILAKVLFLFCFVLFCFFFPEKLNFVSVFFCITILLPNKEIQSFHRRKA